MDFNSKYIAFFIFTFFTFFSGCSFHTSSSENTYENLVINLPKWPEENFPSLSRWLIQIESSEISQEFSIQESSFNIQVHKNQPMTIVAIPLTFIKNTSNETQFFYPAGNIYPYFWENLENEKKLDGQLQLTWEAGFSALLMKSLFKSRIETGITDEHMNQFIASFNWKKFQRSIEERIQKGIDSFTENENPQFYNPWLLSKEVLLENLSNAIYISSYLDLKSILSVPIANTPLSNMDSLYSPFIPENQIIMEHQILTVQKNKPYTLLGNETFSAIITCSSKKKLSVQLIYLPIFIDDYENKENIKHNTLNFCNSAFMQLRK